MLNNRQAVLLITLMFLIFASVRLMFPGLDHGDEYTDASVLTAGANFAKVGFIQSRFLPVFEIGKDSAAAYTHVPPLSDILNGVWRRILHTDSLVIFRLLSLFFTYLGVLCWYFFITGVSATTTLGLLAALFYMTNPLFLFSMDSLHELCYLNVFLSAFFLSLGAMVKFPGRKTVLMAVLWILYFMQSLVNYEYVLFVAVFLLLFHRFMYKDRQVFNNRDIVILLSAPVAAFGLHLLQNAWYFGSMSLAVDDLRLVGAQRMLNSADSPMPLSLWTWFRYVVLKNISDVFLFDYVTLFLMLFLGVGGYQFLKGKSRQHARKMAVLSGILFLSGLTWYVAFPAHSLAHTFVRFLARHLVYSASIGFALLAYIILSVVRRNKSTPVIIKLLLVMLVMIIAVAGVIKSDLPITPAAFSYARDFLNAEKALLLIRQDSAPDATVAVNYFRFPFIRYYTNRHTEPVFDKETFLSLERTPEYFIFMPYNNEASQRLYEVLNEKYDFMFRCRSERFPAVFLKRKK